jgi:G3E family GTPase
MTAPIPVSVLTGFLGSGKTTLLNGLLKDPMLANACVIINEFGDVGIDHLLVEKSDENVVELSSGCLCCTIRGDLIDTLTDLLARRDAGSVKSFDRIVIETTGLADPAPILHVLMMDPLLVARLRLEGCHHRCRWLQWHGNTGCPSGSSEAGGGGGPHRSHQA